jgi:hypothetical protein
MCNITVCFFQDIIEFVDIGSSGFLSDLCLVVASYNDMFINRPHLHDVQQWYEYSTVKMNRSDVHDEIETTYLGNPCYYSILINLDL